MQSHQFSAFEKLPSEIFVKIFLYLPIQSLINLTLLNKNFLQLIQSNTNNEFFERKMEADYFLFYQFIKSTKQNLPAINWQIEYTDVIKELNIKLNAFTKIYKGSNDLLQIIQDNNKEEFLKQSQGSDLTGADKMFLSADHWKWTLYFNKEKTLKLWALWLNNKNLAEFIPSDEQAFNTEQFSGHSAIENNDVAFIKDLLSKNNFLSTLPLSDIKSLLYRAAWAGHLELAQFFLKIVFEEKIHVLNQLDSSTIRDIIPILFMAGHLTLIKYCIDQEYIIANNELLLADFSLSFFSNYTGNQKTMLAWLIEIIDYNYLSVLKHFLNKYQTPWYNHIAFLVAIHSNNFKIADYLIKKQNIDLNFTNVYLDFGKLANQNFGIGYTPLEIMLALGQTHAQMSEYLFYKIMLPELPLAIELIHTENNKEKLYNALIYLTKCYQPEIIARLFVKYVERQQQGHDWYFKLINKITCRIIELYINDIKLEKDKNKEIIKSPWCSFFRAQLDSNLYHLDNRLYAMQEVMQMLTLSKDIRQMLNQLDLPKELSQAVILLNECRERYANYFNLQLECSHYSFKY